MKRITLIFIILAIIFSFDADSQNKLDNDVIFNYDAIFNKANELYRDKKFGEAAAEYEKLIRSGIESPEIYNNIGNCYYRSGKTAETVYFYEKAHKMAPDDDEIINNLRIANLRTIDKYEEVPKFFLIQWFESIRDSRSADSWSWFAVIFLWLAFGLFAGFLLIWNIKIKKLLFAAGFMSLAFFTGSLLFNFIKSDYENKNKHAIIFSGSSYVKSSPDKDGTDLFILHEGAKVKVLEQVGEWNKIGLPNGKTGWMLSAESKTI